MRQLAKAILKPAQVAVMKCKGHDGSNTKVALGNVAADTAAKTAAGYLPMYIMVSQEMKPDSVTQVKRKIRDERCDLQR